MLLNHFSCVAVHKSLTVEIYGCAGSAPCCHAVTRGETTEPCTGDLAPKRIKYNRKSHSLCCGCFNCWFSCALPARPSTRPHAAIHSRLSSFYFWRRRPSRKRNQAKICLRYHNLARKAHITPSDLLFVVVAFVVGRLFTFFLHFFAIQTRTLNMDKKVGAWNAYGGIWRGARDMRDG